MQNVFSNLILCASIHSVFKITTVAVELKIYSEIKDINSKKCWVCDLGKGGGVLEYIELCSYFLINFLELN
jgi:hypothetical protein